MGDLLTLNAATPYQWDKQLLPGASVHIDRTKAGPVSLRRFGMDWRLLGCYESKPKCSYRCSLCSGSRRRCRRGADPSHRAGSRLHPPKKPRHERHLGGARADNRLYWHRLANHGRHHRLALNLLPDFRPRRTSMVLLVRFPPGDAMAAINAGTSREIAALSVAWGESATTGYYHAQPKN
jgi:hypothetical protein